MNLTPGTLFEVKETGHKLFVKQIKVTISVHGPKVYVTFIDISDFENQEQIYTLQQVNKEYVAGDIVEVQS